MPLEPRRFHDPPVFLNHHDPTPRRTSTAAACFRSLRAPVTPFRRRPQLLASTLAVLALVLRLLLPLLHDPRAHGLVVDAGGAEASSCACVERVSSTPWWQLTDDTEGDERDPSGDHIAAAAAGGHCLACAEAHLPAAPPPPPIDVPQLAAAPTPTVAAPRAPPRQASERSQHQSRAPPHARA